MKDLNRKNRTYKLSNLPELSSFSFTYNGNIGYTGSIIRRRLNSNSPFWHYAFIYGFVKQNDELLMIENNENGVEGLTWLGFMAEASEFEVVYYEKDPKRHKEIMSRAYERCNEKYMVEDNNCEHFSNYCVHNKFEIFRSDTIKKTIDKGLSICETQLLLQDDLGYHQMLNTYNEIREQFNIERENETLRDIVDQKQKK